MCGPSQDLDRTFLPLVHPSWMTCAVADRGTIEAVVPDRTRQTWKSDAMNVRYEIHVQGLLGPVLRTAFVGLRCVPVARRTTIRGRLSADELRGLLDRLDRCGVELDRVFLQDGEDDGEPASLEQPSRRDGTGDRSP